MKNEPPRILMIQQYLGKVITSDFILEIRNMIGRKEKRYSIYFQTIDVKNCYLL